jgi:hypothetical protein
MIPYPVSELSRSNRPALERHLLALEELAIVGATHLARASSP